MTSLADSIESNNRQYSTSAHGWRQMWRAWPKCTLLIVANEFLQKFADLGTVLTLYLINVVGLSASQTTVYTSLYFVCGGITPLLGSILADGYIGKFRTILYATLLYCFGKVLMATASFYPRDHAVHPWGDLAGSAVIVIGMGGIVACVPSFSGDQFPPHEEQMIAVFFSLYYAILNVGMIISSLILPLLRAQSCLGQSTCYPFSFIVSAFFMILASVIFFLGSKSYVKRKAKTNIFGEIYRICKTAYRNRQFYDGQRDCLDYYFLTHNCQQSTECLALRKRLRNQSVCKMKYLTDDVKALFNVMIMFAPVPMFWALYGQQYTVWPIQSLSMDCSLWGDVLMLPDQMQIVNPIFIVVFVFLFESVVYPICRRYFKITPLRKMVTGGVLAALAFILSAFLQLRIDNTLTSLPQSGESFVSVMNAFTNCDLRIELAYGSDERRTMQAIVLRNTSLIDNNELNRHELFRVLTTVHDKTPTRWHISLLDSFNDAECRRERDGDDFPLKIDYNIWDARIYYIFVGPAGSYIREANPKKPTGGIGEFGVSLNLALDNGTLTKNLAFCRHPNDANSVVERGASSSFCHPNQGKTFYMFNVTDADTMNYTGRQIATPNSATLFKFRPIRAGIWGLYAINDGELATFTYTGVDFSMRRQGGVYVLALTGSIEEPLKHVLQISPDNTVPILWQLPQKAVMTMAEILFSITGFEFAYSQSGGSMKSVVQSMWFLTASVGNGIVMFVATINSTDYALHYFLFAGAMLVFVVIFAFMSTRYKYRNNAFDFELMKLDEDL